MQKNTADTISVSEFLYLAFISVIMICKGLGYQEGDAQFKIAMLLAIGIFGLKLLVAEFRVREWPFIIAFLLLAVYIYLRNQHLEVLVGVCMVIGMKDMKLKRVMKLALAIWGCCMIFSMIRALLGIDYGYMGTQVKSGLNLCILRYSMGFTHPNVFHITYFVIVMMILYLFRTDKKRLLILTGCLFLGNLYVFLYSVSYTGFIVTTFCIFLNLYLQLRTELNRVEKVLICVFVVFCMALPMTGPFLFPEALFNLFNKALNGRFGMIRDIYTVCPISWKGHYEMLAMGGADARTLDCSFAYMLMYHGWICFAVYVVSFLGELLHLLKKEEKKGILVLTSSAISGITEQYMGNLSGKNISLFFVGDFLFNVLPNRLPAFGSQNFCLIHLKKEIPITGLTKTVDGFLGRVRNVSVKKCLSGGLVAGAVGFICFMLLWKQPVQIYQVQNSPEQCEQEYFIYEDGMQLDYENSMVIGNIKEGSVVEINDWPDFRVETLRAGVSSLLWGFALGAMVLCLAQQRCGKNK